MGHGLEKVLGVGWNYAIDSLDYIMGKALFRSVISEYGGHDFHRCLGIGKGPKRPSGGLLTGEAHGSAWPHYGLGMGQDRWRGQVINFDFPPLIS